MLLFRKFLIIFLNCHFTDGQVYRTREHSHTHNPLDIREKVVKNARDDFTQLQFYSIYINSILVVYIIICINNI